MAKRSRRLTSVVYSTALRVVRESIFFSITSGGQPCKTANATAATGESMHSIYGYLNSAQNTYNCNDNKRVYNYVAKKKKKS